VTVAIAGVDFSMSYNEIKEFGGKRYTGIRVGRSHTWRYDPGEWKERKVTPDRWEFRYSVVKRRAGRAPEGSGAPVGTAYHWYIVADQVVTKLDANSYMTEMVGHKLKIAHKRAERSSWSASDRGQNKQLVKLLRELADSLESRTEPTAAPPKHSPRTRPARHRSTTTSHGRARSTRARARGGSASARTRATP
jgi:hypothetical protein